MNKLPLGKQTLELSYTESMYLELAMKGLSDFAIAEIIGKTPQAVKDISYRLRKKCGCSSKFDLISKVGHNVIEVKNEKMRN